MCGLHYICMSGSEEAFLRLCLFSSPKGEALTEVKVSAQTLGMIADSYQALP